MSTTNRKRGGVDNRSQREIESDIHQTRDRLDDTLTMLEHRLSPRYVLDETFDYFRHGGPSEFAENLGDTVKANPTPFLLSAIGLGWLFLAQQRGPQVGRREYGQDVGSAVDEHGGAERGALGSTRDKTQNAARRARRGMHDAGESMRQRSARMRRSSRSAAHDASAGARNAGSQVAHFVEDNPLAAAAVGIGLGAAIGALFPASRLENEQLGDLRDDLVDRAGAAGVDQAERLESKVEEKTGQSPDRRSSYTESDTGPYGSGHRAGESTYGTSDSRDTGQWSSSSSRAGSDTGVQRGEAFVDDTRDSREHDPSSTRFYGSNRSPDDDVDRSTTSDPARQSDAPAPGARGRPGN